MNNTSLHAISRDHWPKLDRQLWIAAKHLGDPFDKPGRASNWRPDTIRLVEGGYGCYLAWLSGRGLLSPDGRPIDRVEKALVAEFIKDYRVGRADGTVALAVRGVADLLRATHAPNGLPWLTKLAHSMTNRAQPAKSKVDRMATIVELVDVGMRLMETGRHDLECGRCSGAQGFRDGLMVASLAMRPLRRRNFAALQIGETLICDAQGLHVSFTGTKTKKGNVIEFDYPSRLTKPFRFYLRTARPILRARSQLPDDGMVWIGRRGCVMDGEEITQRVTIVTRKHLGRAISPHLFRDCVATDIAIHDPKHIGIVTPVLGHTHQSSKKFYNQASSFQAAHRHRANIARLRGDT